MSSETYSTYPIEIEFPRIDGHARSETGIDYVQRLIPACRVLM